MESGTIYLIIFERRDVKQVVITHVGRLQRHCNLGQYCSFTPNFWGWIP